ncbi:MAG: DUF305 domain-containing protein [Pseudomonadota bacterium]|nr:DUF305 domain-containing protein [Sphingomonas sp.]MDQ3479472.1 DUF305 domain-containing protein [Pseudomonadota bacterium]
MRKTFLMGAASAMALLVAACGSNEEPAQNEIVAANDMNMAMADPNNPFAQAEGQMHQAMAAAVGADPSDTWIRKMIEHHRGAVAMSDIVLAQNPTPDVRAMAEKTKTDQSREISKLEAMLSANETSAATVPTAAPPAQTSSAPAAESRPKAAETNTTKPVVKPAPKPAPKAAEPADPHAGHDMNNMQ